MRCYVCHEDTGDGWIDYKDDSRNVDHISVYTCSACLCSVTITFPSQVYIDEVDAFLARPHLRLVRKGDIE